MQLTSIWGFVNSNDSLSGNFGNYYSDIISFNNASCALLGIAVSSEFEARLPAYSAYLLTQGAYQRSTNAWSYFTQRLDRGLAELSCDGVSCNANAGKWALARDLSPSTQYHLAVTAPTYAASGVLDPELYWLMQAFSDQGGFLLGSLTHTTLHGGLFCHGSDKSAVLWLIVSLSSCCQLTKAWCRLMLYPLMQVTILKDCKGCMESLYMRRLSLLQAAETTYVSISSLFYYSKTCRLSQVACAALHYLDHVLCVD